MRHILIILFIFLLSFTFISCRKSSDSTTSTETWTKQLGTFFNDWGYGVTTDSSDNIYITGDTGGGLDGNTNSLSTGGTSDIFLVKYDSSGTKQ